ncbi:MAG: hypothetical protein IKB07_07800 [Lachnospiraceae bacterium]|nr:hypothetical protein [Lachnospiraceae bacterium]
MFKLKKFAAAILAVALCVSSIAVPAPKEAEAATYCCHTIYFKGSKVKVRSTPCCTFPYSYSWNGVGAIYSVDARCFLETDIHVKEYGCYKCSYTYSTSTTGATHHSHPECPNR